MLAGRGARGEARAEEELEAEEEEPTARAAALTLAEEQPAAVSLAARLERGVLLPLVRSAGMMDVEDEGGRERCEACST